MAKRITATVAGGGGTRVLRVARASPAERALERLAGEVSRLKKENATLRDRLGRVEAMLESRPTGVAGRMDRIVAERDVRGFREVLGLSQADAAVVLGCSERAVQNYEAGTHEVPTKHARVMREVGHVVAALEPMVGLERVSRWFGEPVPDLGGRTPIAIIAEGDLPRLVRLVEAAASGEPG